jgi:hypothetical protein
MSMNVAVDEAWVPEPELQEAPPRRVKPFTDYKDLNRPNLLLGIALGSVLLVIGLTLFVIGLSGNNVRFSGIGIGVICLGLIPLLVFPWRARQYQNRVERLVTHGVPVMARIISADNLNGSEFDRNVKYMANSTSGDAIHKDVNIDDRLLPKRIPANVTALMDFQTGEVELYLALPFRATARPQPAVPKPMPMTTPVQQAMPTVQTAMPVAQTGEMATIQAAEPVAAPKREKPKEEEPKKRETFE